MDNTVGTTEAAFVLVRYPVLGRLPDAPVGDAGSDRLRSTRGRTALLNISVSRVKVLLQQGRIKGAKKEGRVGKIPRFWRNSQSSRARSGFERNLEKKALSKDNSDSLLARSLAPYVDAGSLVNKPQIDRNRKQKTNEPVITIRQGSRKTYCHLAEVKGSCKIVYQPDNPLSCGAVVWIEVVSDTVVIPKLYKPIGVAIA